MGNAYPISSGSGISGAPVSLAGDRLRDRYKKLAETYLGSIPAQPLARPVHLVEPPQTGERRVVVRKEVYPSLVDQEQLATDIGVSYGNSLDPTLFWIYGSTNQGVNENEVENAIYEEIEKIKKDGITEKELEKIKNQKLIQYYQQIETINGKANNIGVYEVFFGDYKKMFDA